MEEVMNGILIREVETKNIMTKSSLPVLPSDLKIASFNCLPLYVLT